MSAPESSAAADPPAYRIADLELDVGQARLTREGHEIPLPKLSFDLLLALVEAAPRLLTLDELMQRVWRGVIVSPETISQRVKLLRDVLGDDAAQPRYVASVRGRGYRLVAGVETLRPASVPSPAISGPWPDTGPMPAPVDTSHASAGHIPKTVAPVRGWGSRVAWLALAAAVTGGVLWTLRESPVAIPKPPPAAEAPAPATPRAVAVLPFTDLSGTQAGSTLALGIAETLRHQLAGLKEIDVIGQSSSTAMRDADVDLREVGRRLHARYLLGGSVQSGARQLRVTAQLVDATTGLQLWSIRFDRAPEDVFAMEDEIAVAVTKALALSVDADARGRLTRQGTTDFDAYLAYLQGRALLSSGSVKEAQLAASQFERAIAGDGNFAAAYVALAEAIVFAAEYDPAVDRRVEFPRVIQQAALLVEQALAIDPALGAAYLQRGYLRAFFDRQAAEKDLRRGLELSPNDARGYARLASVVFEDRRRGAEALALLDRARRLEPLEPEYDVTRAVYELYGRGDVAAADDMLVGVLKREPLYAPALGRLAELRFCCQGRLADAVQLGQQALALDPLAEWTRRVVIRAAVGMGLPGPAKDAIRTAPEDIELRKLPLLLRAGELQEAAEICFRAIASDSVMPIDEFVVSNTIREDARRTHDYERAIAALTRTSGVSWDKDGHVHLPERAAGVRTSIVGLADVLILAGRKSQATQLLETLLADMKYEAEHLERSDHWFLWSKPVALMLLGRRADALAELEREDQLLPRVSDSWYFLERDPVITGLRNEPGFQKVVAESARRVRWERERYVAMHPGVDQASEGAGP